MNELGADVDGSKKEVQMYLQTTGDKVKRIKGEVEHGISEVRDKVEQEKEQIEERGDELKGAVDREMTKFGQDQEAEFTQAEQQLNGVLTDDKAQAAQMVEGLQNEGKKWQARVDDEIADVPASPRSPR